jgi:hypothetical protein
MQPLTTPVPRVLPHPWDLHMDQCRGTRCVWCKDMLGDVRIPAGTVASVHQHGSAPERVVTFNVFACPACAKEGTT